MVAVNLSGLWINKAKLCWIVCACFIYLDHHDISILSPKQKNSIFNIFCWGWIGWMTISWLQWSQIAPFSWMKSNLWIFWSLLTGELWIWRELLVPPSTVQGLHRWLLKGNYCSAFIMSYIHTLPKYAHLWRFLWTFWRTVLPSWFW